jgi:hypothetical protein
MVVGYAGMMTEDLEPRMRGRNPDTPAAENQNVHHGHPHDPNSFGFAVWQLKDGEDRMIADRLAEILQRSPEGLAGSSETLLCVVFLF